MKKIAEALSGGNEELVGVQVSRDARARYVTR